MTPVDTRTAAAGDAVSAWVTKAVRARGSNEILVAAGAMAHGRILAMQHQIPPAQFQISIGYDTLEQNGVVRPLTLELERDLKVEESRAGNGFATHGTEFSLLPRQREIAEAGLRCRPYRGARSWRRASN